MRIERGWTGPKVSRLALRNNGFARLTIKGRPRAILTLTLIVVLLMVTLRQPFWKV